MHWTLLVSERLLGYKAEMNNHIPKGRQTGI